MPQLRRERRCLGSGHVQRSEKEPVGSWNAHASTHHPAAPAFPVSVKGVAVQGGRVLLLENERNEWELPGGKIELREDPAHCVVREIREEAGWEVTTGPLLDCWQYHIREGADVVIVTYGCHVLSTDPPADRASSRANHAAMERL